MALFAQYTKPGVYTRETVDDPGIILFGDLRIPVFIGEGQESFSVKNVELHRGSSSVADDLVVKENFSDQATGFNREFSLTYFPVVKGDGTGTLTNVPTDITVLADGVPATVTSLNGTTGVFQLHNIYPVGTQLEVSYYFKRQDTFVENEDLSPQIPTFADWTGDANMTLTLSIPGELGSSVQLALTSLEAKTDAFAVSGAGTNLIAIELRKADRVLTTLGDLTFTASTKKVARTTGSWVDDGVVVGDGFAFSNTVSNNTAAGTHLIATLVTATEVTFGAATLVNETVSSAVTTDTKAFSLRTYGDLNNIIDVGIPTPSGYITLQEAGSLAPVATDPVAAVISTYFRNGVGPNTNTTFKLKNTPIVDGANGGVVTTNPIHVVAKVNNLPAQVRLLDGLNGIITMASPVLAGQTFTVSYYTNNYQDTYDLLPASNVASLDLVGYGPDREDFINTVDYVLETPAGGNARIQWGAASTTAAGIWTAGYNPFDASVITTTLVDQIMFLQPIQGTVDGRNAIFTLPDVPTDGSGLARPTNNPALVHVYVGTDPNDALQAGEVRVIQCFGATGTIKLYSPPAAGNLVYATYYRNILNDHTFTLTVVDPGIVGQGTYRVTDELGNTLPVIQPGTNVVTEADHTITGTVWPHDFSDLTCVGGDSPDEVITVTFQAGDADFIVTPAVQATIESAVNTGLKFRSTNTGTAPNGVVSVQAIGVTDRSDATAVDYSTDAVKVYITKAIIPAVKAQGTITVAGLPVANQTFTVGAQTFTWVASGTATGNVVIGANPTEHAQNIVTSITRDLVTVAATNPSAGSVLVEAATAGTAGNSILFANVDSTGLTFNGSGTLGATQAGAAASGGQTRTLQEIINLFSLVGHIPTRTATGVIICEPLDANSVLSTAAQAGAAENFSGGAAIVTTPRSLHYRVTSNRTAQQALADGLGRTGGATTPVAGNWTGPTPSPVGNVGYLNQTYNDLVTGVNFTVINPDDALLDPLFGYTSLPSPRYHFQPGDVLTFTVSASAKRYTGQVPTIDLYGTRVKVVNTYGMRAGDTATVTTYNKAGNEPQIGDFYFVSYTTHKTDADYSLKIFTNPADAYKQYGDPNATNKLSMAARLYSQNGGEVFGAIQVRKDIGLETAADQTYMTAISSLAAPLPGSDRKADMIVPMTTSPVVIQHLNRHLLTQGSQRNSGEATGIYGYDFYATPDTMRALSRSLKAERMIGIAVPGAILEIDIQGKTAEFAVGGEFLAAAMTGMMLNPAIDVATTLTRQNMTGFSRLIRRYDDPTMDLMAADGLTCLVERSGAFQIRHWVTTDNTSPLKREPTSRLIIDYVRKILRRNLDQFIGRKLLQSAINSVTVVTTSTLKSLVEQEIIEGFKNLQVNRDDYDPTVLHVLFTVKPIFSLLWIDVALTVTTKL